MARTVKWTEVAADDLYNAAEFIAKDSPFYAMALVREARAAALSLGRFADRGRIVPESNSPEIRELFIKSYRLIYQTTSSHIFILAFIHGARDLATIWTQRNF
jgi:plasmid stabilization system protein ParE